MSREKDKIVEFKPNMLYQAAMDAVAKNMWEYKKELDANIPNELKEFYIFNTQQDDRVCEICAPLHSKVFPSTDDAHEPPLHELCRCYTTSIYKELTSITFKGLEAFVEMVHPMAIEIEFGGEEQEEIDDEGEKQKVFSQPSAIMRSTKQSVLGIFAQRFKNALKRFFRKSVREL